MPVTVEPESVESTFARLREREKKRFHDERKGRIPLMDAETLRELCVDNDGYETPELNDNLYAHFQGFQKIEGLEPYYNLKALWLESNGLSRLENLAPLVNLRCLYLSKNLIERIEGLESLKELNTLDLSENRIKSVAGLACLPQLSSLNLSRNLIESKEDLVELASCTELSNLDISHNQISDTTVLEIFTSMPKLRALRITGNEVVSKTKYFRKVYISSMPQLAFLDRPIFPIERTSVTAWAKGGNDAELVAKRAFVDKEHADRKRDLQAFRDWQAQVRERRIREIEEEKARKLEQEKDQQPETEELREEDVDLRGFRGITKREYIQLSPADRAVWDERIDAAHRDSTRDRHEVLGDGVSTIGARFWADEKQKATARGQENVSVQVVDEASPPPPPLLSVAPEEVALQTMPPPAPSLALKAVDASKQALASLTKGSESAVSLPLPPPRQETRVADADISTRAAETAIVAPAAPCGCDAPAPPHPQHDSQLPPPPPVAAPHGRHTAAAEPAEGDDSQAEPKVFQRDAAAFFRDAGEARRSWAELEQQARASPFRHRPTTLPSMMDQHEDETDDETTRDDEITSASATCDDAGFPIRALTRDEILRELAQDKAQDDKASSDPRAAGAIPAPASFTNVAALD